MRAPEGIRFATDVRIDQDKDPECATRKFLPPFIMGRRYKSASPFRLTPPRRAYLVCFVWSVIGFIFGLWLHFRVLTYRADDFSELSHALGPLDTGGDMFLFVAVLSAHKNEELRNAARRTWVKLASRTGHHVAYRFFVGALGLPAQAKADLLQESRTFNDTVILANSRDSYEQLTEKLLMTFEWVAEHCDFDYLLKLDDDSFARIDLIADELGTLKKRKLGRELYWGFFSGNAPVFKKGKWAEPVWYLRDRFYLPYARGGGYVLSNRLVMSIQEYKMDLERYFSEDVSVGVWLAPMSVERKHDRRFDTEYRSRGCFNSYLVTHKQTASMMYEKYRSLEQYGVLCQREVRSWLSYDYNWNVVPSKCCVRNLTDASLGHRSLRQGRFLLRRNGL